MGTGTHISVILLDNKVNVVVSSSPDDHAAAIVELIQSGGRVLTEDIYGHSLNKVDVRKEQ